MEFNEAANPGDHTNETVHYMVVVGTWQLSDGSVFTAGTVNTSQVAENGFEFVSLGMTFSDTPVVMSQTQTSHCLSFVYTRQQNLSAHGFEVALQEEVHNRGSDHANETAMI